MRPVLRLVVQFASASPAPTRAQVRRWASSALGAASRDGRRVTEARLVVRFVDVDEGRALNRDFRGKDYATNVLTFPLDDPASPDTVEADLVVCLPVVAREADEQGKPFVDHCAHLVVHGTLHACGYDHEDAADADRMEALERAVLARMRIADPYRVEGLADPETA